jgi:PQQ-dependent catabolism-associated beta-propeller protein
MTKRLCLSTILPLILAGQVSADRAFVTNERSNTVTVLNIDAWTVEAEFFGGNRPRGITASPDGTMIYVCASDDDSVRVFSTRTYEELPALPSGPDPENFVLEPNGNRLFIANEDDNLITVTNTGTGDIVTAVPVGVEPEGMAISPDGAFVVNTSETTNMAHFISTGDYYIKHNVLVDQRPRHAKYSADGTRLYVTSEIGGTVAAIDIDAHGAPTVVGKIEFSVPGVRPELLQPVGAEITSDGKRLFVALGPANRVAVVDTESLKVRDYILVGQRVWHMAFTPDEKHLMTTNGNSNDVTVIDVTREKAIRSIQVGQQPWGIVAIKD